jgi:quercetin dioxygenase-like cupin family protein
MRNINLTSKIKLFTGLGILALSSLIVYAALPPVATILGDGTNASVPLFDGEPARVTARHLVTPAFDVGGWHYHPGYVHNVVIQGTIKIEDGCGDAPSYSAGQAFETSEGRVHRAINEGSVDAIEYNMFIGPPGRPLGVSIPGNERRCGPVSRVEECMKEGWRKFDFPFSFDNQGACIAYVNQRRQVTLLVPEDHLR